MQNNNKLREALVEILRLAKVADYDAGRDWNDDITAKIIDIADRALAAPARNCDLARDWLLDLYAKFKPPATVRREMPPEWVDAVMAFCRWLVAQAPWVKEGETKCD